jgi:8-oxo-dGTP diphosphatase
MLTYHEVLEPEKCEGWYWVSWDEVCDWCDHHDDEVAPWADKKCFLPIRNLVKENRDINLKVE